MKKLQNLKYTIPVMGIMFWVTPCYSFGFPTFDIAEVAGTIKGVTTSNMSLVSTTSSTASTAQMLIEKGEGVSSLLKFKDEAVEKAKKAADEAKKAKTKAEKAAKAAKRAEELGIMQKEEKKTDSQKKDETKEQKASVVEEKQEIKPVKTVQDGEQNMASAVKEIEEKDTVKAVTQVDRTFKTQTVEKDEIKEVAVKPETDLDANDDKLSNKDGLVTTTVDSMSGVAEIPQNQGDSKLNEKIAIDSVKQPITSLNGDLSQIEAAPQAQLGSISSSNADVVQAQPIKQLDTLGGKATVSQPNVGTSSGAVSKSPAPVLNAKPQRAFKQSVLNVSDKYASNEHTYKISSRSSFAQMGCPKASGLTDDGTFVFSDIIAEKCCLDYKDAEDEDKVRDCLKTWVECMNQEDGTKSLECIELYRKAMHDQVSADLSLSINNKKYASTFQVEVMGDIEKKSNAATTEREEGSSAAIVNTANQEVLLRMMNAMASQVLQTSFLAVEQIDASYYEEK